MKKLILLILCSLFLLTGCKDKKENTSNNQDNIFKAGDFKWEKDGKSIYVTGNIQNVSDQSCSILSIDFMYISGDIKISDYCMIYDKIIKPNEITKINCKYDKLVNYSDYSIEVTNIHCITKMK